MLHPVNLPNCFEALRMVMTIQEELLELALTSDPCDINSLKSRFDADTVRWLWDNMQKLLTPLREFYQHPDQAEKVAILSAFRHDITYDDHLDNPNFTFQLQPKANIPSPLAESALCAIMSETTLPKKLV